MKVRTILFAAVLLAANTLIAQNHENVEQVGRIYNQWPGAYDVVVEGDNAFVAAGVPVELGYDDGQPRRDPLGPDMILYDDGRADRLNTGSNYWSKVIFDPQETFRLQGIRFLPLNQYNNHSSCFVRVYSIDQDNFDLDEMVYEYEFESLDDFNNQGIDRNWHEIVMDEDDWVTFGARESFTIMYGPAPGGVYQAGRGYWNLIDGSTIVRRSYIFVGNQPIVAHNRWTLLDDADLILRAHGTYLEDFVDLAVDQCYNRIDEDNGQWMMYGGAEQQFYADIINVGRADLDGFDVAFSVKDADGEVIFESAGGYDDVIEIGDTLTIECEDIWEAPDEAGNYTAWATLLVDGDNNQDNDEKGCDQIVIDPHGAGDMWIGYIDDEREGATNWNEDSGWSTLFYHPGGDEALKVTSFKVEVSPAEAGIDLEFGLAVLNLENNRYDWEWNGTQESESGGIEWVEVELDEEDQVSFTENQALIVMYFYVAGVPIRMDGTPPIAGENSQMPRAMMSTQNDGDNLRWSEAGDFPIQVQLNAVIREGKHLRIVPDELEFGNNLIVGDEYTIEAVFRSFGDDTVEVRRIIPERDQFYSDWITLSHGDEAFHILPGEEEIVTVTLLVPDGTEWNEPINTNIRVITNAVGMGMYLWSLHAAPAVLPEQPISLRLGWNMISINVFPSEELWARVEGPDVVRMMEQLRVDEEHHLLFMIKSIAGRYYVPHIPFNNFLYWNLTEGYQVRVLADCEAIWAGEQIPADADIPIDRGWNMIAYFPTYELPIESPDFYAISPILDHVIMIKNIAGRFARPDIPFSNMPPLTPGQGYQIRVDEDVVLNYPEELQEEHPPLIPPYFAGGEARTLIPPNPPYTRGEKGGISFAEREKQSAPPLRSRGGIKGGVLPMPVNTGHNMSVLVTSLTGHNATACDQVAAFSSDGQLVGVGDFNADGMCGLAVWGDDESTDEKDGLLEGEPFELRLSGSDQTLHHDKELIYHTDDFVSLDLTLENALPTTFYLDNAFPNPFNSITRLSYGLPVPGLINIAVYDIAGRQITTLVNREHIAGVHTVTWDASDLSSGVYVVKMESEGFSAVSKVVLMK